MADRTIPGLLSEEEKLLNQYYAPRARPSTGLRRQGNPIDSANLPVDVLRGRLAGLLGLIPDVLNFMGRSPMPTETFGETQYDPRPQLPFDTEYYLKNLPLAPTSRVGQVAGQAASFVPLNPAPAVRAVSAGARALGPTAARMTEGYLQRQGLMPSVVPEPPLGLLTPEIPAPKPQAPVSELGFYSAAEQAAMNLQRGKGTGQSFLNDLMKAPDVKKDELQYTGLDEFLKDKTNVTRQEVTDYLSKNKVDVEEVQFADKAASPVSTENITNYFDEAITPNGEPATGIFQFSYGGGGGRDATNFSAYEVRGRGVELYDINGNFIDEYRTLTDARQHVINESEFAATQGEGITKFGKYQLPGGENYREILLKLPSFRPSMKGMTRAEYNAAIEAADRAGVKNFQSSHFDEPNILAHMRVNDRVDADGKKMLLVEEIQSDWHQAGREKGYATSDINTRLKESEKELEQIGLEIRSLNNRMARLSDDDLAEFNKLADERQKLFDKQGLLIDEGNALIDKRSAGVPDAPFKDTWYQLSLKRLMKYAADNGYERVGLTTGKQQADRYKLSNEVDEINVTGRTNARTGEKTRSVALDLKSGTSYRLGVNNDGVIDNVNMSEIDNFKGKKLSEVVGKDIAKQIMEGSSQTIKGEGLNIGGEGMKRYYDEIYPKYLEKYGKKFDAKVGETKVNTVMQRADNSMIPQMGQEPVRYIDITPKMKEGVSKGQPLFAAAPIGVGLGATQEDQASGLLDEENRALLEEQLSGLLGR